MKKYTMAEVEKMIEEIKSYNIEVFAYSLEQQKMVLKYEGKSALLKFKDFSFQFEGIVANFGATKKVNTINFTMEDLQKGILKPSCTCGGEIECYYDGEYSEDYTFTCECGSKEVLNGYMLDSLLED